MIVARMSHFSNDGGTVGEAITESTRLDSKRDPLELLPPNVDTQVYDASSSLIYFIMVRSSLDIVG